MWILYGSSTNSRMNGSEWILSYKETSVECEAAHLWRSNRFNTSILKIISAVRLVFLCHHLMDEVQEQLSVFSPKSYLVDVESQWQQADPETALWPPEARLRTHLQGLHSQLQKWDTPHEYYHSKSVQHVPNCIKAKLNRKCTKQVKIYNIRMVWLQVRCCARQKIQF